MTLIKYDVEDDLNLGMDLDIDSEIGSVYGARESASSLTH